jgi:hypothetical protein
MIQKYDDSANYIDEAIKVEDRPEYRYMNAESLYKWTKKILEQENSDNDVHESKQRFMSAKDKVQLARENLEQARTHNFSSREIRSLRQDLNDLLTRINGRLQEITDIEEEEYLRRERERERELFEKAERERLERDQREEREELKREDEEKEAEERERLERE